MTHPVQKEKGEVSALSEKEEEVSALPLGEKTVKDEFLGFPKANM